MAVNPNIALSFQQPKVDSPLNVLAQVQQLQGVQQANQMRALQMDELRADREQQNALAQFMQGYQPGVTDDRQALRFGAPGRQAFTALTAESRARAEAAQKAEEARRKTQEATIKALGTGLTIALADPSDDGLNRAFGLLDAQGVDTRPFRTQFATMTPEQRFAAIQQYTLTNPEGRAALTFVRPTFTERGTGAAKFYEDTNPNSPTFGQRRSEVQMQQTPDNLATNTRIAAEGAANRAVQVRGQNMVDARARANGPDGAGRAPTLSEIVDPANPGQMLRIDARTYRGGSVGAPGVIGVSGKEPAVQAKAAKAAEGQATLSEEIAGLQASYDTLHGMGAMTSTGNGVLANVGARTRSTAVGQLGGSFAGTPEQTVRDNIRNAQARLTQAIKQATGMSAQQMNSNVELQLWLRSVTDPTQSYETVTKTLGDLDRILAKNPASRRAAGDVRPPPAPGPAAPPSQPAANDPLGIRR